MVSISSESSSQDSNPVKGVENFIDIIRKYSDIEFKKHFSLRRDSVLHLIGMYVYTSSYLTQTKPIILLF